MNDKEIIEAINLTKIYGSGEAAVRALDNLSITVHEGEFAAIMGPSGSGKSTLLHLIGCLDKPTEGRYLLDGVDARELDDNELAEIRNKKIGFVFQQFNLLARTTALENVVLPLTYGKRKTKDPYGVALEMLRAVGLEDKIYARPNELSGGQQQRVAIARALVNNPSILLADEPTGNLDSKSGDEIMTIFDRLNREGKTIILITHEKYIADHAKRIIHLKDGRIVSDEKNAKKRGSSAFYKDNELAEMSDDCELP